MKSRLFTSDFIRNFTFGVEDSLVSTVGLVSGIAIADVPRSTILLTGVILIFVEAFSMSVGSLLSDNSARELESVKSVPLASSLGSAVVMFFSYFLSGFIILAPYVFLNNGRALPVSIGLSVISLFALGAFTGNITKDSPLKKGLTMALIGGFAVLVGITVGSIAHGLQ